MTQEYVTGDTLYIAEIIREIWGDKLKVQYLDPKRLAMLDDKPYQIVEVQPDGREVVVLQVPKLDHTVIDKLVKLDTHMTDTLAEIDRQNAAVQKAIRDANAEKSEHRKDVTSSALTSRKHTWTFKDDEGNLRTIRD